MRIIKESTYGPIRISIFSWNNKYLIKLETPFLEQTFKIDQLQLESETQLDNLITEAFIKKALVRFEDMAETIDQSLKAIS